jgi:hypothetical protein
MMRRLVDESYLTLPAKNETGAPFETPGIQFCMESRSLSDGLETRWARDKT